MLPKIQLLNSSEAYVRYAAASAFGRLGEKAASQKVLDSLIQLLNDSDEGVRGWTGDALGNLASKVREEDKPAIIKLALPLTRTKRRDKKNDSKREAGYVMLRNLLATKGSGGEA